MSTTLQIYADKSARVDEQYPQQTFGSDTTVTFGSTAVGIYHRELLVGFPATVLSDDSKRFKLIERAKARIFYMQWYSDPVLQVGQDCSCMTIDRAWDPATVTYANKPTPQYLWSDWGERSSLSYQNGYIDFFVDITKALTYGLVFWSYMEYWEFILGTSRYSSKPYIELVLSDDDAVPTVTGAPSGGYKSKHAAITLSWSSSTPRTISPIVQTNATVRWREGSSGEVHTITNKQTVTSHTLAAETVTGDELQWQVTVTYNSGATATSPWYSISTVEPAPSQPEIIRPQDTLVDGTQPITLEWRHVISTGTPQTAADLQTSTDGTTWTDLAQISGAGDTYTVAAGTWTGGTRFWRVRTYNTDSVAGAWSDAAQVDVVAGPGAPVVACTTAPRPEITWQAAGQQGFEAEIGGQSSGVVYGTGKAWQPPEFVPDGPAVARVRVVNSYGLWSDWGEVNVTISNPSSGAAFAVTTYAGREVGLTWSAVSGASAYWIYRDGVKIGQTEELQYTDRWSNGSSVWKVRAIIGDGYRDSAEAAATVQLRFPIVSALDGSWIELKYSTEAVPTVQTVNGRDVALLSVQGASFPMAEVAPYKTRTYAITAAFPRSDGPAAFEALLGREVVLKDQYGKVLHGVMASITTTANRFFYVCSAQLQEMEGVE